MQEVLLGSVLVENKIIVALTHDSDLHCYCWLKAFIESKSTQSFWSAGKSLTLRKLNILETPENGAEVQPSLNKSYIDFFGKKIA